MTAADHADLFTQRAWDRIADWREAVETMPFIRALADGSLPTDAFAHYLTQDAAYLVEFARALSMVSQLAPSRTAQAFFAQSAHTALDVESALHRDWLRVHGATAPDTVTGSGEASPVTVAYTDHLLATCARGSYPVAVAAVLPCYWLYAYIGDTLLRRAGDLSGHRYERWIATYADPAFQDATATARRLADEAAESADRNTLGAMFAAFERSSTYEYLFFDQGIRRPTWPTPATIGTASATP